MPLSTQSFVDINSIRDGIVILNDGSLRAVLLTTSVNLGLKSTDEQEATVRQFQDFLNTLDFSVQILVQSRRLDIAPYIELLEKAYAKQTEELLKLQTAEYIDYIKAFSDQVDIMKKNFFVVVPFYPSVLSNTQSSNPFDKIMNAFKPKPKTKDDGFEQKRSQLEQRLSIVEEGINRLGIRSQRLTTKESIELFHRAYNPGSSETNLLQNYEGFSS